MIKKHKKNSAEEVSKLERIHALEAKILSERKKLAQDKAKLKEEKNKVLKQYLHIALATDYLSMAEMEFSICLLEKQDSDKVTARLLKSFGAFLKDLDFFIQEMSFVFKKATITEYEQNRILYKNLSFFDLGRQLILIERVCKIQKNIFSVGKNTSYERGFRLKGLSVELFLVLKNMVSYQDLGARTLEKPFYNEKNTIIEILVEGYQSIESLLYNHYALTKDKSYLQKAIDLLEEEDKFHKMLSLEAEEDLSRKIQVWKKQLKLTVSKV